MRKYVIGVLALIAAIAIAIVVSSQLRDAASAEADTLPAVVVAPPAAERVAEPVTERETGRVPAVADTPPPVRPTARDTGGLPRETARPKAPIGAISPSGEISPVPDQGGDAAAILKRTASAYANVRSLKADFTQWQENPLLGRRTSSRGTIYQRQPDRFLMKFSQPAGDVIVSDGQYFWVYYPSVDARQVLRSRAADAGGLDLLDQFIGDPTRRFGYTAQGSEPVGGRPARVFTLVPRAEAGYKSLKVWIDTQDYLVRRFELTTDNGVVQHYDLANLEVNPTLSDQLFRFTPPKDARIVER